MFRAWTRLRRTLLAVLLAMLVVVPAVEAAVCLVEDATAHAVDGGALPMPDDDAGASHDDACAHGHCHHGASHAPPRAVLRAAVPQAAAPRWPDADRFASRTPDGLKRPPRG
ncbi:hypothetical protein LDO32_18480 [Luteimonas sp. Y-2-2-4F]|nr:hypothetical protein [Luteimonas sp. Y-2-2-4F]MCD9033702.1 hypothetical protein [Luteimonas sp. Y-2-2-4F]